jgi:cell division protein FtsB
MAGERSVWVRRLGIAAVVALALGWLPWQVYSSSGLARYLKLRHERDQLHADNLKLHADNQRKRAELEAISEGPGSAEISKAAVERAARDELGLVKPGEVVFKIENKR